MFEGRCLRPLPAKTEDAKGGQDEESRLNQNRAGSGNCQPITLSVQDGDRKLHGSDDGKDHPTFRCIRERNRAVR